MPEECSSWSRLRGLEPVSLCDWPGRISAVLFMGGCDLRCPTCHNPVLAWTPEKLADICPGQVRQVLDAGASWLDGLVVTGGEAALSPDLPAWMAELRATFGLPVKLDTNGMHPEVIEASLRQDAVDLIAVDVKGPPEKYPLLTGGRASPAHATSCMARVFDLAAAFPEKFAFRCTLVPDLNQADLEKVRCMLPTGFSLTTQTFFQPRNRFFAEGLPC